MKGTHIEIHENLKNRKLRNLKTNDKIKRIHCVKQIHNATTENVGKDNKTSPARKGKINYAKIECNDRHVVFFFKSLISEW